MRDRLDLSVIDLNLLPKFRALYRHRSVSDAGRELCLTQSALSNALARMRSMFEDELFVRTPAGMEPTPFAHAIAAPIERTLAKLEDEFSRANGFEPERSSRTFKIAMTQLGEVWLAPQTLAHARTVAPDIAVMTVSAGDRGLEAALSSGAIDYAVGHLPHLEHALRHTELAIHEMVCMLRDGHPVLEQGPTLPALLSCTFAEIVEHGAMHGSISRAIVRIAKPESLKYRTSNVMALPQVVAATDLVAIVPAWFAARCAASLKLCLVRFANRPMLANIRLFWHENLEKDPGHLWMRSIIARAAAAAQIEEAIRWAPLVTVPITESIELVH
jgi:DNA-binding transcriptional LysR family regulator